MKTAVDTGRSGERLESLESLESPPQALRLAARKIASNR
jgi:hypothetical protein